MSSMPGASPDIDDAAIDDAADVSADMPEMRLPKPSWRWRLLFCVAIACALVAAAVAVMPELFLSQAQAMASHVKR
jgi:hypothetical protein